MWKQVFYFYSKKEDRRKIFYLFTCVALDFYQRVLCAELSASNCPLVFLLQRVLEADAAEDAYNDADDFEVDTPKRRHRGKGRVSN